jgi:hypothetical protein
VPVALGNAGPTGIRHAARHADVWCPIDASLLNASGRPDVNSGIRLFRDLAAEAGRDPDSVPITLFAWNVPKPARLERYAHVRVDRVVLPPPSWSTTPPDAVLRHLDHLGGIVALGAAR